MISVRDVLNETVSGGATPPTVSPSRLSDDTVDPEVLLEINWDMSAGGVSFEKDISAAAGVQGLRPPRGVFAEVPGATPKYAVNDGQQEGSDFREKMARMFLQVPNYQKFLNQFAPGDPSLGIAKVLGGTGPKDGTANKGEGSGYIDFILQSVQHSFQEKSQVVETLGDDHVAYFFGQGAPSFNYGGTLINTKQDDQAMNMLRLYRDMGRGTMLARRNTLISIRYDGLIVSGAMLNLTMGLNADMETAVPFNFVLLVKQVVILPNTDSSGTIASGLVHLEQPFATSASGYKTFSRGIAGWSGGAVKIVLTPPEETVPAPPASAETDPNAFTIAEKKSAQEKMSQSTVQVIDPQIAAKNANNARTVPWGPK